MTTVNGTCNVTLTCSVEKAERNVTYSWSPLGGTGSVLQVLQAPEHGQLTYTCTARNPVSNHSSSISAQQLCAGASTAPLPASPAAPWGAERRLLLRAPLLLGWSPGTEPHAVRETQAAPPGALIQFLLPTGPAPGAVSLEALALPCRAPRVDSTPWRRASLRISCQVPRSPHCALVSRCRRGPPSAPRRAAGRTGCALSAGPRPAPAAAVPSAQDRTR